MINIAKKLVKHRILILIIGAVLIVPSVLGMIYTRVNYDILYYLPDDIETMVGQDILHDEFGKGAFALLDVEGMKNKDVSELKSKIENTDHVASVIWYDSIADVTVPMELLPDDMYNTFNSGDSPLMAIFFDDTT